MRLGYKKLLENYEHLDYLPKFITDDGRPALTGITGDTIGDYVLMTVRDPLCGYNEDSAQEISKFLEDAKEVARTGMFVTYTGTYKDAKVSIVSGGSGAPEAELILNEFMSHSNANTFIRVGGCGAWHESVHPSDVVISSGAVRDEGMTKEYVVPQYPAFASYEVLLSLIAAARDNGHKFHVGITRSGDSEYCGWGKPSVDAYIQNQSLDIIDYYNRAGILNTDRETSAIFTLATLFNRRCGSICSVGDNVYNKEGFKAGGGHEAAISIALEAVAKLYQIDKEKEQNNIKYWVPSQMLGVKND
ncbi:MAG: nucleoside phosphorylase [Sphaerochaetaceae bacterium]|nr:nucleoside phosphorylase [Sphaerochaetaceae bacterium]